MMRNYDWNPYKDEWHHSDEYKNTYWNYDPRDENYYLGKINTPQNTDMSKRYYSDGYSDRYYHNDELKQNNPAPENSQPKHPYVNNDFLGNRKRNYSFEGPHRGKGPKNYIRSIERIKDDASDRLMQDTLVDASDVEMEVNGTDLILSGTVNSLFEKHRAEALVANVSGVKEVENKLRIKNR